MVDMRSYFAHPDRLRRLLHHKTQKESSRARVDVRIRSPRAHAVLALVASSTKYTSPLNGTPSEWFESDISHVRDVE